MTSQASRRFHGCPLLCAPGCAVGRDGSCNDLSGSRGGMALDAQRQKYPERHPRRLAPPGLVALSYVPPRVAGRSEQSCIRRPWLPGVREPALSRGPEFRRMSFRAWRVESVVMRIAVAIISRSPTRGYGESARQCGEEWEKRFQSWARGFGHGCRAV
jgi:hypothetical protein